MKVDERLSFFRFLNLLLGSSSGIGEGIAIKFASLGANVVITGRNRKRVKSVADKCRKISKNKVLEVVVDLQNDNEIKNLVKQTIDSFGKIDILINCAGIVNHGLLTDPNLIEQFDKIFKTNLRSVVLLISLVVPYLELTKGNIVNVSSITSKIPVSYKRFSICLILS